MNNKIDVGEVVTRAIKYVLQGLVVSVAAYLIPNKNRVLKMEEVVMLGLTAAAVFAVLDMFAPSVAASARGGAGFGLGASLVSWPGSGYII